MRPLIWWVLAWGVFVAACSVEPIRPTDTYERAHRMNEWWGAN